MDERCIPLLPSRVRELFHILQVTIQNDARGSSTGNHSRGDIACPGTVFETSLLPDETLVFASTTRSVVFVWVTITCQCFRQDTERAPTSLTTARLRRAADVNSGVVNLNVVAIREDGCGHISRLPLLEPTAKKSLPRETLKRSCVNLAKRLLLPSKRTADIQAL